MERFDLRVAREGLGLSRLQLARLIGYTGTDANDERRIRSYESKIQTPLYIVRLVDMIQRWQFMFGKLPDFPEWPGYEFEHTPDSGDRQERIDGVG